MTGGEVVGWIRGNAPIIPFLDSVQRLGCVPKRTKTRFCVFLYKSLVVKVLCANARLCAVLQKRDAQGCLAISKRPHELAWPILPRVAMLFFCE